MKNLTRYCDGFSRRDMLRVGAAGLFGTGFSPELLMAAGKKPAKDVSLIVVFLQGGLSTIDTFDMKPDAPSEFRGEFNPMPTNVPGIQIAEQLPLVAGQMDKFSLIRSFGHRNSDHGAADHYMLTGYHTLPGFNPNLVPNNQRPSHGSIIARKLGPRGSVPAYVCLPQLHRSAGSAYLGPASSPFTIESDPSAPDFAVPDVLPPMAIDATRLDARRELLARVDRFQKAAESGASENAEAVSMFRRKAFDLMTSAEAKKAFDITAEPGKLRDEYGRNSLGQSCLMARRLVNAGVRCVTVQHTSWDTHDNNFRVLKNDLLPKLDMAMATLFRDLSDRGLLDSTIVVVTGEFGRTPRVNKNAGRDHWGPSFTVMLGGGGFKGGRAIGKSDARAERPAENPFGPEDMAATMYSLLGINPEDEFFTPEGRPIKIANNGRVIKELL